MHHESHVIPDADATDPTRRQSRRALVVITLAIAVVASGGAALYALVDEEEGYSRSNLTCPSAPGQPSQMVSGVAEVNVEAPASAFSPTSYAALESTLPQIMPALAASAFTLTITPDGMQAEGADSEDTRATYEMRSPTGELLARVDVLHVPDKGWSVEAWEGCASFTGAPGPQPTNFVYDPNEAPEE